VLIDVLSRDRYIRRLASEINAQLRELRVQRQRFIMGDAELKNAVTNIAHDLRTPLTAISGYLQLLEREEKSETVCRYLDMIANRTEALRTLTEELFKYSILTSQAQLKAESVIVNAVLEESLAASYGLLTQQGIEPTINITDTKVERMLDRSALSRIFENIISNATKYADGDFAVSMSEDGKIEFSNTASELDAVSVGRIFDRFYTVETGRNSTGIGLSIAKLLTERMGGSISAQICNGRLTISVEFIQSPVRFL
jgi:signal transduction histidine kinase